MATANFAFPELVEGSTGNIAQHNQNLAVIEAMLRNYIVSANLATPPVSPAEGSVYFVDSSTGLGDWAGNGYKLAIYINGGWVYRDCPDKYVAYIADAPSTNDRMYRKNGENTATWTLLTL